MRPEPTPLQRAIGSICLRLLNDFWDSDLGGDKHMRYMPRSFHVRYNNAAVNDLGEVLLDISGANCMTIPVNLEEDHDNINDYGQLTITLNPGVFSYRASPSIIVPTEKLAYVKHPSQHQKKDIRP